MCGRPGTAAQGFQLHFDFGGTAVQDSRLRRADLILTLTDD